MALCERLRVAILGGPLFDYDENGCENQMRMLAPLIALACAAGSYGRPAAVPETARSPVLIELFTSEGCSSCPPVDALVRQLDASQPFSKVQLIVLSEHVDYWNHDGWKDPYSSSLFTQRQEDYVQAFRLDEPYTPQIVLNGTDVLRSYSSQGISAAVEKAAGTATLPVKIGSLSIEDTNPPVVRVRIEADGNSAPHTADVYLAVALDHAESQVSAGENNGKRLAHVAILEYLKKIGKVDNGKSFVQECQVKLKKGTDPNNLRVIAFVQEPGPGKVLGVVLRKAPVNGLATP